MQIDSTLKANHRLVKKILKQLKEASSTTSKRKSRAAKHRNNRRLTS
jgi:hypothetical protein